MINLILWLLFGACVGWLASLVLRTSAQQSMLTNVASGVIGALIGGFLFGGPTINTSGFSMTTLIVSLLGSIILLAVTNILNRQPVR
ncbi:MAG TPA: GlsB/YeaQ/YmgE family stress response membrane protein [Kouleothrix sp.]|nr:GlsB/YeaQ/YmgE family stress response membrane protein [Kouleothrix sp.]